MDETFDYIAVPQTNRRMAYRQTGVKLFMTHCFQPLVKFKSHLYFEEKDCVSEAEKNLKPAKGSRMTMFKNGQAVGVAFEDVFEGTYYPAISLYKAATVNVNFGPVLKFPPTNQENFPSISETANQAMVDYALADILYHIDNEGRLPVL